MLRRPSLTFNVNYLKVFKIGRGDGYLKTKKGHRFKSEFQYYSFAKKKKRFIYLRERAHKPMGQREREKESSSRLCTKR